MIYLKSNKINQSKQFVCCQIRCKTIKFRYFLCFPRRSKVKLSVFLGVCVVLGATSHVCTY